MRSRPVTLLAVVLAIAALAPACSGSDGDRADEPAATSSTTQAAEAADVEVFTGTDDEFYEVPDPLPPGEPGDLIRVQELEGDGPGTTLRIMYRSVDSNGDDRAVTGLLTYPDGEAPEGGWPVVSSAHGTTGIASPCAPSRWTDEAPSFGLDGVVAVATDYIGLGPVGEVHPYLSGVDEGRSVIDAVRAARNLPEADASGRWVAWGHSQGGHASLFANELGESHAPELELLGTVAIAPAAELSKTYGAIDEVVANVVSLMGLYGAAAMHDDIVPSDYVGDEVEAHTDVLETACLDEITSVFAPIPRTEFYDASPIETEPARSLLLENDPGTVAVDSPLYVVQGDLDIRVHPQRTADLMARLCAEGQVTDFTMATGTDHGTVLAATADQVTSWLQARLDGEPATDACVDGEAPASATP